MRGYGKWLAAAMVLTGVAATALGQATATRPTTTPRPTTTSRPASAPATTTRPEDWSITWNRFLETWEIGDARTTAYAFAKDQGQQGGNITLAEALLKAGDRSGRTRRQISRVASRQDFPLTITVTVFWTVKPPAAKPDDLPTLLVTEEKFGVALVQAKPYVTDYAVQDITKKEVDRVRESVKKMRVRFEDKTAREADRMQTGTTMVTALAEIADIEGYWSMIQEMSTLGLSKYPEEQKRLVDLLQSHAKDDPVPPKYKELSEKIKWPPKPGPR